MLRLRVRLVAASFLLLAGTAVVSTGCDDNAISEQPTSASAAPGGLTPKQAAAVLAKVGDEEITLGEYAAVLERMNQFDRLRFQTTERRRQLLRELIDLELLAQEARRRGLDKKPEVQEAIRQILREAMLAKTRQGMRAPAEIPAAEVQAYYDKNKEKFREPERRRVSAIELGDAGKADEVLKLALAITSAQQWGELYFEHSLNAPDTRDAQAPADLAGDLGIVGPPGDPKGASKSIAAELQRAVFELKKIGDVYGEVVSSGGRFYIVRMVGRSKGHTRSVAEADRAIRVAILQDAILQREQTLEADLRKRFPVRVDEAALKAVKVPEDLGKYKPYWEKGKDGATPAASSEAVSPQPVSPQPVTP
jgi:peptidyl-prolyl cis-trans isomerase C